MRQPHSSVLPISAPDEAHDPPPGRRRDRPNLTERVAGWSAAHRKTAVFGWLFLVAALFMGGQALGAKSLNDYSPGQAGQAERILDQFAPAQLNAPSEMVLIQARAPGATFATDPAMRQAASQVAAALAAHPGDAAHIQPPLVSKDGRSALVTFRIPGNVKSTGRGDHPPAGGRRSAGQPPGPARRRVR